MLLVLFDSCYSQLTHSNDVLLIDQLGSRVRRVDKLVKFMLKLEQDKSPTTMSLWVKALVHLFELSGFDREELLNRAQISDIEINYPDVRIETERVAALWHSAEMISANDAIGVVMGQMVEPYHLNPLGNTLISCSTVGDVIDLLCKYVHLIASHSHLEFIQGKKNSTLRFGWASEKALVSPHAFDVFITSIITGLVKFTQQSDCLVSVSLQRPTPKQLEIFERCYQCPIQFNQAFNEITVINEVLSAKLITANPALQERCGSVVDQMLVDYRENKTIVDIVRIIERDLANARLTLALVAQKLNKSERGVQRLLKESGYTYRSLLETVRKRVALENIVKPGTQQKQVAYDLGYHTQQAFCRAFKQWTGMTPSDYISFAQNEGPQQSH